MASDSSISRPKLVSVCKAYVGVEANRIFVVRDRSAAPFYVTPAMNESLPSTGGTVRPDAKGKDNPDDCSE